MVMVGACGVVGQGVLIRSLSPTYDKGSCRLAPEHRAPEQFFPAYLAPATLTPMRLSAVEQDIIGTKSLG